MSSFMEVFFVLGKPVALVREEELALEDDEDAIVGGTQGEYFRSIYPGHETSGSS